ncbi:hypothetical protein I4F81_003825 [Pyropia yezoensis]|uniref:Uncharacterized protein n=1 Tax=Pyropia yezoensis TaxID=2788 RepID=A0ACC3BT87_PYRYE|nr:hypothetical protein I4F81_003825 [Neopyropia yezoensis]
MPGDAVDLPPPGQVATGADDAAALRARLLDAEARLTQTQRDLSAAQQTITALHAQRWGGQFSGGCSPVAGGNRRNIDAAGAYDDGFDFCTRFSPDDWLQSFDIPRSVLPPDGLPMPFTPCDPVHTATFTIGSRDEIEARHLYCTLAWTQSAFNDLLAAQHAIGNTKELLEELVEYLVGATRRIYALGVSRWACRRGSRTRYGTGS